MSHTVLQAKAWEDIDSTALNFFVPEAIERILVLAIGMENASDTTVTGVTWGGQDMTSVAAISTTAVGEKNRAELWMLDCAGITAAGTQPAQGYAFNISWSSGEPTLWYGGAGVYKFVDQVDPMGVITEVEDSTDPIPNPITSSLASEPGSINIAVGVNSVAGNHVWDPYWNERIQRIDGITFSAASRIFAEFETNDVGVSFTGGTTGRAILIAAEFHRSSEELPEILVDSRAGGAVDTGTVVEFDIIVGSNNNKFLAIAPTYEFAVDETGYTSLVQVNGEDAVFVGRSTAGCPAPGVPDPSCVGIHNTADLYYFVDPPDGTCTIRVECTMVAGVDPRDMVVAAVSLYNVGPPAILSIQTDFDDEPLPTVINVQHPTQDLTGNAIIIESLVIGNPDPPLTADSNQIKVADQQGAGSGTCRGTLAIKYAESTPLGYSQWTQLSDLGNPGNRAAMVSMAIDSFSDSTAPTYICTNTEIEDLTLEFCEDRDLLRMVVENQGDTVSLFLEFDTCTLQVLNIITSGTSSRNIRFTFNGTPTDLTPNDTEDVSSQGIYLVPVGPYYLPTLTLEGDYSITFI